MCVCVCVCVCVCLRSADRCFWNRPSVAPYKALKYISIFRMYYFVKYRNFRYGLAFVVGVTMDRWHHSQSYVFRKINECAMVKALEQFWNKEGRSLIGFVWAKYFFPSKFTLTDRAVS
jgi:hypothetical protein